MPVEASPLLVVLLGSAVEVMVQDGPNYEILTQLADEELKRTSGMSSKRVARGSDGIGR